MGLRVRRKTDGQRVQNHMSGLSEHFLIDDDQNEQDENSDYGTGYETLFIHPKIQRNLLSMGVEQCFIDRLYAYRRIIFLRVPEALSIEASAVCSYVNRNESAKRK